MYHDNLTASSAFPQYKSESHGEEAWKHNRTFRPMEEESEPDPPPPPPPDK